MVSASSVHSERQQDNWRCEQDEQYIVRGRGSIPELGFPGEGNGNLTPVFLPGEPQGQRILVGDSSYGLRVGHD